MSDLKPLVWSVNEIAATINITAESPLHNYTIYPDQYEGGYVIYYFERMTSESGREFFNSSDEAKDWAESTHYPSKMKPYVKPLPTWIDVSERLPEKHTTVLVVYHAHFDDEPITEFDVCTAFFDGETFDPKDQLFYMKRNTTVTQWMLLPKLPSEVTK